MSVLVVSVSHKSTSVAQLAELALDASAAGKLADQLLTSEHTDTGTRLTARVNPDLAGELAPYALVAP